MVLKAHSHTPKYTGTANLTAASRAALDAIDLHFHDLRREAGSRWLEGGVPLHTIRDWLRAYLDRADEQVPCGHDPHTARRDDAVRSAAGRLAKTCNGFRKREAKVAAIGRGT